MRIFTDITDFRNFVSVPVTAEMDLLNPIMDSAQEEYIIPVVSRDQFTDLLEKIDDGSTLSTAEEELRDHIKRVVANATILEWIPIGNINIQQGGFTVNQNESTRPASQYRVEELKESLWNRLQTSLDLLIKFVDDNEDDLGAYLLSDERTEAYSHFINQSEELATHVSVKVNRWLLRAMRPVLTRIEQYKIKAILSEDLFDEMIDKISTRESLGVYAPILPLVQRALAHLAFSESIEELGVQIGNSGAYIGFIRNNNDPRQTTPVDGVKLLRMIENNRRLGEVAMEKLKLHLLENASSYPLYEASAEYTDTPITNEIDPADTGTVFPGGLSL